MSQQFRLSDEDFNYIYNKVPRLNVDLIVHAKEGGIVLIKRAIEPYIGSFHLPGGTVYKNETIVEASIRVAKNETGFDVEFVKQLGFMDFPNEKRGDIFVHTVSIVIEVKEIGGELKKDNNAKEIGIFTTLPENGVPKHFAFLREHNILN